MTEKSHAKFYRNLVRVGLCTAAVSYVQIASAFVAPEPPPGFGGTPGNWTFAPPSGANQVNSIIREAGKVNVSTSGGVARIPVAARLKAAASRVAAAAIFANPYVRVGAGIAAWLAAEKLVFDPLANAWREEKALSDTAYSADNGVNWYESANDACSALASSWSTKTVRWDVKSIGPSSCVFQRWDLDPQGNQYGGSISSYPYIKKQVGTGQCPPGWSPSPAGCLSPEMSQPQFVDKLGGKEAQPNILPEKVPGELPYPTPLPIDIPIINPSPSTTDPKPTPYFQPTGNPVPNPNYNPSDPNSKPYVQPGIRITPSPTEAEPWRLDIQPINKPVDTNKPVEGGPETNPDDGSKPKPEEQQSLCEKHPDILACSKPQLDTPEGQIPKATREVTIDFVDGGDGACPADAYSNVGGQSMLVWDWQATCTYTRNYVKPVILVGAMFMALMIVLGGTKE